LAQKRGERGTRIEIDNFDNDRDGLTLDNGDGSRYVVGYENDLPKIGEKRTRMEIDDLDNYSNGSRSIHIQRSIFDGMDPGDKSALLTQENGTEEKTRSDREAKLKNV
jgi:hypothetical protein